MEERDNNVIREEEIRAESDRFEINEEDFPLVNSDWIISLFMESSGQA